MMIKNFKKINSRFLKIGLSHGFGEAIFDFMNRAFRKLTFKKRYYRIVNGFSYPICFRFDTTDYTVFDQVFSKEEYNCMSDVPNPQLIIDCGANIGLTSLYFLNKFPQARLIAVEPDVSNLEILRRNLSFYKDQVTLVHSGVWSKTTGLVVVKEQYKGGGEDATQVRECPPGAKADLKAATIDELLKRSSSDTIDILKIDIERAEAEIFKKNYESWLPKVKNIVIELHDKECEEIFFKALEGYTYERSRSGELTVIKNLRRT